MNDSTNAVDLGFELGQLLSELTSIQAELLELLVEKRPQLIQGEPPTESERQARQQQLAARLQQCHERRVALLGLAGEPATSGDSRLPPSRQGAENALRQRPVEHSADGSLRLLRHPSLANWVLAQRSLLHIARWLERMTAAQRSPAGGDIAGDKRPVTGGRRRAPQPDR